MKNLKKVTLSGKEYPIAYNILRMEEFAEGMGMSLGDFHQWMIDGKVRNLLIFFTDILRFGAERSGQKFNLSVEDVADLVGFDIDVVNVAIDHFMPSEDSLGKPQAPSVKRRTKKTTSQKPRSKRTTK